MAVCCIAIKGAQMYTLHEHNVHGHGASKFVSCITSAGLGPVGENLLIIVPYDLVSDLVKVKDLRKLSLAIELQIYIFLIITPKN